MEGFEDEDMELQAALQASLMGATSLGSSGYGYADANADRRTAYPAPVTAASADPIFGTDSGRETPVQRRRGYGMLAQDMDEDIEETEETSGADLGRGAAAASLSAGVDPIAASRARSQAYMEVMRRQQEAALRHTFDEGAVGRQRDARAEQEEAELMRAIEESRRAHEARGEAGEEAPAAEEEVAAPTEVLGHDRVYDDEDAELQAALRASLETVPDGFRMPNTPPHLPSPFVPISHPPPDQVQRLQEDEFETESEAETGSVADPEPQMSMEEMRRKRLAKFGG